jgi:large subunit ribosomal protein L17
MRFAMTAKTLSNLPEDKQLNEITAKNVRKVTLFRENGMASLRHMVEKMKEQKIANWDDRILAAPKRVYLWEDRYKRDMHYPELVDDWKLPNMVRHEKDVEARKGMRITRARTVLKEAKNKKTARQRAEADALAESETALAKLNLST